MGQALYRQYRPRSLGDVAGQEHVTTTLEKAVESGQISHAYLLTGPRGTGKTTVARILAHAINNLPYDDDSTHVDIIEIDAASNRRIDEIRELRERVYTSPTELKYKVYIIDEVHMLTREAFNALLKTLEEPPAHVVFILATTDSHKLPETIISRTQRYSFRPISEESAIERLKQIAGKEKIKISGTALKLIAEHGDGSLRDSISLLDQVKSSGEEIDENSVKELLGLPSESSLDQLAELALNSTDYAKLMQLIEELYANGYQAGVLARSLSRILKTKLIKEPGSSEAVLSLLKALIDVPASLDPESYLEIVLLESQPREKTKAPVEVVSASPKLEKVEPSPSTSSKSPAKPIAKAVDLEFNSDLWPAVLSSLKKDHNTLYGIIRMASPVFDGQNLTLTFAFPFHQKRINESANKQLIAEVIKELTGKEVEIECIVDKNMKPIEPELKPAPTPKPQVNDSLSTISSIFNGAELLES